jgi:hypothetical protein
MTDARPLVITIRRRGSIHPDSLSNGVLSTSLPYPEIAVSSM